MSKTHFDITDKIVRMFFRGSMCFNGLIFFKVREDYRERNLKREIYGNVKSGDYKYLV